MKATEAKLLTFLEGKKQFIIPIYQRTYSWNRKQCQQLWNDIVHAAKDDSVKGHFLGSIVYIEKGLYHVSSVPELLVIDGQQRLTTVTLLLAALSKALQQSGSVGVTSEDINEEHAQSGSASATSEDIDDEYLFNKRGKDEQHYKLILTQSDKDTLIHLIEDPDPPKSGSARLITNYKFFQDQIHKTDIDLDTLFKGISKLFIVDISLNREYDNPQLIFESLNSTALVLTQADLIRNYVLMGLEPKQQTDLYRRYWFPMEESFGHAEYTGQFNRFMRDYLTVKSKSGAIPNIDEVYVSFKDYVQNQQADGTIEPIVADIHRFAMYFVNLAFRREQDPAINQAISDINTLRVEVAYPFLMEVYDDYRQGILSRDAFVAILRTVESYVFRRAICEIPTNSLNKTFATLSRSIDKGNYLESVQAELLLQDSYREFPDDDEFERKFMSKDVYNFRNRNYLLDKLENYEHKERLNVEAYTIEHIMPQNPELSQEWQRDLGSEWQRIQKQYLHTIGNLTLTGYNPELSDRPFQVKRDMVGGFADSHLRLNQMIAKLEFWNVAEIEQRAKLLARKALKIWSFPQLSDQVLERQRRRKASGGSDTTTLEELLARSPAAKQNLFFLLRNRILNLDASVKEIVFKERRWPEYHIGYQSKGTFTDVVLQADRVRLVLNIKIDLLDEPRGIARDVSGQGYWGGGDVKIALTRADQIDYVMELIRQAYQFQEEMNGD